MSSALVLCSTCDRHRRASDDACPFCGGADAFVGPSLVRKVASRAAIAFGGVALATAVSCSPKYGGPPPPDPGPALPPPTATVAPTATAPEDAGPAVPPADASPAAASASASAPVDSGFGTVPPLKGTGHAVAPAYGGPPRR